MDDDALTEQRSRLPFVLACATLLIVGTSFVSIRCAAHNEAVRLIEENGGAISFNDDYSFDIHHVNFDTTLPEARALDDARLAQILRKVPRVEYLNLKDTSVSPASIPEIVKLKRLRDLVLPGSAAPIDEVGRLNGMPVLRSLLVQASDSDIDAIKKALPHFDVRKAVDFPF